MLPFLSPPPEVLPEVRGVLCSIVLVVLVCVVSRGEGSTYSYIFSFTKSTSHGVFHFLVHHRLCDDISFIYGVYYQFDGMNS